MPLAVASMHVPMAREPEQGGAEQKKAVQDVKAMPCKYRWAAGRTGTMLI